MRKGRDDLARALLKHGASLRLGKLRANMRFLQRLRVLNRRFGRRTGCFPGKLTGEWTWPKRAIGGLIGWARMQGKQPFTGEGTGGKRGTHLKVLGRGWAGRYYRQPLERGCAEERAPDGAQRLVRGGTTQ